MKKEWWEKDDIFSPNLQERKMSSFFSSFTLFAREKDVIHVLKFTPFSLKNRIILLTDPFVK